MINFTPDKAAKYCDRRVSSLPYQSTRITPQKRHVQILRNFLYMLPVALALSLCNFRFCGWRHVFT